MAVRLHHRLLVPPAITLIVLTLVQPLVRKVAVSTDLPPSAVDLSHLVGTDNHHAQAGNKYLGTGVEPSPGQDLT